MQTDVYIYYFPMNSFAHNSYMQGLQANISWLPLAIIQQTAATPVTITIYVSVDEITELLH